MAEDLDSSRARVERAQRALLPYAAGLDVELQAEVRAAEQLWNEARAGEERGDTGERVQESYAAAAAKLGAVRARVAQRRPELLLADLLARADGVLEELADGLASEIHLELLDTRVSAHDSAGAEQAAARALERIEADPDPMHAVVLVRQLSFAASELAGAEWTRALRARAVARVMGFGGDEIERTQALLALLEAQAEWSDLAGARATLAELEGELRQHGLLVLVEAEARAGDFAAAAATRKAITIPSLRAQADVLVVEALANKKGAAEAMDASHALEQGDARSQALVKVAGARARAGESAAALELAGELDARFREEALLVILEEEVERGDLGAAERTAGALGEASQSLGWSRLTEAHAHAGDFEAALAAARRIPDPFRQAAALEHLAWERVSAGDREGAAELFALALEVADVETRGGHPGRLTFAGRWLVLASRIQTAIGDLESARMNVVRFRDAENRRDGWMGIGWACARSGNVEALEEFLENAERPEDRVRLLGGAADAAVAAVWRARHRA